VLLPIAEPKLKRSPKLFPVYLEPYRALFLPDTRLTDVRFSSNDHPSESRRSAVCYPHRVIRTATACCKVYNACTRGLKFWRYLAASETKRREGVASLRLLTKPSNLLHKSKSIFRQVLRPSVTDQGSSRCQFQLRRGKFIKID